MNIATLPTTNALVQNKCYLKKCDSKSTYPEKKDKHYILLGNILQTFDFTHNALGFNVQ